MATNLDTQSLPITFRRLDGGLNTTSGPLGVEDNELTEVQNMVFDKFGSVLQRNGYTVLGTSAAVATGTAQSLYWYTSLSDRYAILVNAGKIYKMDDLDGAWDDITGGVSFAQGGIDEFTKLLLHCDGDNEGVAFTDSGVTGHTITNTETYGAQTVLMLHCNGANFGTSFTDSSLSAHSVLSSESYLATTKLMLHCDGADGSTGFTDSSLSAKAMTASNTELDTAQLKFGTTSALFDGTGWITTPDSDDWFFSNTNFTIDFWAKRNAAQDGTFITQYVDAGNLWEVVYIHSSEQLLLRSYAAGTPTFSLYADFPYDTDWHHVAVSRSGQTASLTNWHLFIDGVEDTNESASYPLDATFPNLAVDLTIGYGARGLFFNGWMDEIRVRKVPFQIIFSEDFTPPVVPYGFAAMTTETKKFDVSSGAFNGEEFLQIADSADWDITDNDFTIDCWINLNSERAGGNRTIVSHSVNTANYWVFIVSPAGVTFAANSAGVRYMNYAGNFTFSKDTWYHVAVVVDSFVPYLFVNGTPLTLSASTPSTSIPALAANLNVGRADATGSSESFFEGYIDELRITKGIARWTNTFTPYSAQYGQVATVASQARFGSAGAEFRAAEFLTIPDSDDWDFASGDFTIDFWTKLNQIKDTSFMGQETDANNSINLNFTNGQLIFQHEIDGGFASGTDFRVTWSPTEATWYHIALVKQSTTFTYYVDGTSLGSDTSTNTLPNLTGVFAIGRESGGASSYYLDGWMDEIRVSKGIARWTSNFTRPTKAYGDYLLQDLETFLGYVMGTDEENVPWQWIDTNSTASDMTVVSGLTKAKLIKRFQNYLFLANVTVSGVRYPSRFYWSNIRSIDTWSAVDWIEVNKDDGDEINGLEVLGDRLVVYKQNSIYVVLFTGNVDIPFIVQKSNSAVGCAAPFSIQETENGHVFCSQDGIYFFDGYNSFKLSDRINDTFDGLNSAKLELCTSMYQAKKNLYWLACPSGTSEANNFVLCWNSFLNAWTTFAGMSASAMSIFNVGGTEERPYFADQLGWTYRADNGLVDYPTNTITAISAHFATNWKSYNDICDRKGVPHIYVTHKAESSTVLSMYYGYDFFNGNQYTQSFSLATVQSVTSYTARRDLKGRGRFVRLKFENTASATQYRVDGLGTYITRETKS